MDSTELQLLRRFKDSTFAILDKYIRYLAKTPGERAILMDVKQEIYERIRTGTASF